MAADALQILNENTQTSEGFPYPDWNAIDEWAAANLADDNLEEFWGTISREWMEKIRARLGEGMERDESERIALISKETDERSEGLLDFAERALSLILIRLEGVAKFEGYGKHLILLMPDYDTYWQYLSHFHPEGGEFAASVGMCIDRGYCHTVLGPLEFFQLQSPLLHELTHACLRHLPLPAWLNEAFARAIEIAGRFQRPSQMDSESFDEHMDYWTDDAVQTFWAGTSFHETSEGSKLSYQLSEILLNIILKDIGLKWSDAAKFANEAHWKDAGEEAARHYLGRSLGAILGIFLGEGDLAPDPERIRQIGEEYAKTKSEPTSD